MARKKTTTTDPSAAAESANTTTLPTNGPATAETPPRRRTRAAGTRASAKTVAEPAAVVEPFDVQSVREHLRHSEEAAREVARQAELAGAEAREARERLVQAVGHTEREAAEALARAQQVRQQIEAAQAQHCDLEENTRQALAGLRDAAAETQKVRLQADEVEQELQRIRGAFGQAEQRLQEAQEQHLATASRLIQEIEAQRDAAGRHVEEAGQELATRQAAAQEEYRLSAQRLIEEIERYRDTARQHAEETGRRFAEQAGAAEEYQSSVARLVAEIERYRDNAREKAEDVSRTTAGHEEAARLLREIEGYRETARRHAEEMESRAAALPTPAPPPPERISVIPPDVSANKPAETVASEACESPVQVGDAPPPAPPALAGTPPAVVLEPGEEKPARGRPLVSANIRVEAAHERLVRYLHQSATVKGEVASALQEMADDVIDPRLANLLREHRALTERQRVETETRLREFGATPPAGKGYLQRLLGWAWDSWQREPDDLDRTMQELLKAIAAQEFEAVMGEALARLSGTLGDEETAAMARRHADEKEESVTSLRPFIASVASLVADAKTVGEVVRAPLRVEVDVEVPKETGEASEKSEAGEPVRK